MLLGKGLFMAFYWKRSSEVNTNIDEEVTPVPTVVENISQMSREEYNHLESGTNVLTQIQIDQNKIELAIQEKMNALALDQMTAKLAHEIILEQVQKILPDLAEKIIKEELVKLLQQQEALASRE